MYKSYKKAVKPFSILAGIILLLNTAIFPRESTGSIDERENLEKESLWIKRKLLSQELELASKPQIYFLLNLGEKRLELKARGLVLKEWKIKGIRRWGAHPEFRILTLEKKSALFAPKRKKIKPGEVQSSKTFELEALELKDMPAVYTLNFNDGVKIYIRPEAKKMVSRVASLGFFLRWYGWFPVENLFFKLILKKTKKIIELTLPSSEEAKSIYWSLLEGMKGLIFTLAENRFELN